MEITEQMMLRAVLDSVLMLARRLTGDQLTVSIDDGDGTVRKYSDTGEQIESIPQDMSIAGRIESEWSTARVRCTR